MKRIVTSIIPLFLFLGAVMAQDPVIFIQEDFGAGDGYAYQAASDFGKYSSDIVWSQLDTVLIRNQDPSTNYPEASGENHINLGPFNNGSDTVRFMINSSMYNNVQVAFGIYHNTDWGGITNHNFWMWYSTDSVNWTEVDKTTVVDTFSWPNNKYWRWVWLADELPSSETLYLMIENHEPNHMFYLDDLSFYGLSKNANLDSIKIDGELVEEYWTGRTMYHQVLDEGVTTVPAVEAWAAEDDASVDITDAAEIPGTTVITVTAPDGVTTREYVVNFYRPAALGQTELFKEEFGEGDGYWSGPENTFTKYDNPDNFNTDALDILIRNGTPSTDYAEASGGNYVEMQGHWNWDGVSVKYDSLMIIDLNTEGYKNVHLSFGIYNSTGWSGIRDHAFQGFYSVEGGEWMEMDKYYVLEPDTFPANQVWGWVTLAQDLPATTDLDLLIVNPVSNVHTYFLDDLRLTGDMMSSDASLSDLKVGGTTVDEWDPGTLTYDIELEAGTVDVPEVTYTVADPNASAEINEAGSLPGTTTVTVTAEDGTEQVYTINFTVASGIDDPAVTGMKVYPNPVSRMLHVEANGINYVKISNVVGQTLQTYSPDGTDRFSLDLGELSGGIYFIEVKDALDTEVFRIMKQ